MDAIQILLAISIGIFLIMLVIRSYIRLQEFKQELRYLNQEIGRTTGREQAHYIRRKKRLFLSLIPFVKY